MVASRVDASRARQAFNRAARSPRQAGKVGELGLRSFSKGTRNWATVAPCLCVLLELKHRLHTPAGQLCVMGCGSSGVKALRVHTYLWLLQLSQWNTYNHCVQ